MQGSDRRRIMTVVAASAAFHLGLLGLLTLQRTTLKSPAVPPLEMDVSLAPFFFVEPQARGRQARAPLRARRGRPLTAAPPLAPLYAAPATPQTPPGLVAAPTAPGPGPDTAARLGLILRRGGIGCGAPDLAGLSQVERDRCLERLGAGARAAAFPGLGLDRGKQAWLDAAAAEKQRYIKYRDAPMPPGISTSDAPGGLTGLGETPHAAKIPF